MEQILALPVYQAVAVLFVVVMCRANATYWLGRGLVIGADRTRFHRHLSGRAMARARAMMARWGVLAVPLSFLTVGVQTAVNATAGATRMPLRRYLPAVVVGCVLWSLLYASVGLAVLVGAASLAARSPWLLGGVVAVLAVLGVVLRRVRRARARRRLAP